MNSVTPDLSQVAPTITPSYKEMLTITEADGQTVVRINSSSINILQNCPRKSQYELLEGWKSKSQSPALTFGSALHAALEVFYDAPRVDRQLPPNWQKNIDMMAFGQQLPEEKDFLIYTATRKFIEAAEPLAALPDTDMRSIQNGVWILSNYFTTYTNDPYIVWKDSQGASVIERRLEAPIFDTPTLKIILFGTVDVVLQNEHTGEILPTDHKTSSWVGKDFYNRIKPNAQYTCYVYLGQQCLGLTTDKFMVNCLGVKKRPTTARGTGPQFPRQVTNRTPEDIEEFIQTTITYVKQYLANREAGYFPMGSVDSCANYGQCKYLEVCSSPQNLRQTILENTFTQVKET